MADDNTLEIKFRIDASDAHAAMKRAGDDQDRVTAKADAAAKKMAGAIGKAGDAHAAAAGKASRAHAAAADQVVKSWGKAGEAQTRFIDGLKSLTLANLGFGSVVSAIRAVGGAFADSNKQVDDYAKNLIKVKDDLKELATLKGLVSADDRFIKQIADFGRATGLTISESDQYQRQFLGSLAAGQAKGNITPETTEDLMREGARVASRQTHDLATRGDLLGVISQFQRLDPSAKGGVPGRAGTEMALAQAEAIRQALTEGRGDDAPLTQSLLKVAGSFVGDKGPVPTLPEMAAIVGVTSLSAGAGQADSRAEALIRALRGTTPEQMAFLRSQGVNETDTFQQKFNVLAPKLLAQQAAGRDLGTYLVESGFNDEQARALSENVPLLSVLNQRMAAARNARPGAALIAESDALARTDPNQRMRLAEAELAAARLGRGVEREAIQPDVVAAHARLVETGRDTSVPEMIGDWFRYIGSFGRESGVEVRAKTLALEDARARAGVGAPVAERALGYAGDVAGAMLGPMGPVFGYGRAAAGTIGEGIMSSTGGVSREMLELKAAIEKQTAAIEGQTRAITGAIGDQTKRLEPGKVPVGPLGPARPGAGWTR